MAHANWIKAAALSFGLLAGAAKAAEVNANEPDPAAWLRQVYDLYHRAEKNHDLDAQANFRLVVNRASKKLAALFAKNDACEAEQKGICALDWDFIIDGQDFKLSNVKVAAPVIAGDKASVKVTFVNLGSRCANTFEFVREDGAWKVEDIETQQGKDAPLRIAKLLEDYDYTQ
jgi:hypothetical protein